MSKKLDVAYCPFKEVIIQRITSELLEKIGALPLLILNALERKESIVSIAQGICMEEWVITDISEELVRNQLLQKNEDTYVLTELGESYIRIHRFIQNFTETQMHRFAVNLFTCQLEKVSDEQYFSQTARPLDHHRILHNKLQNSERMILSPNYENTVDFMKQYLDMSEIAITENDYQYIIFQLEPIGDIFYVPYTIMPAAYLLPEEAPEPQEDVIQTSCFWADIPVTEAQQVFMAEIETEPDGKRNKDALLQLYKTAPNYISEEGQKQIGLISIAQKYTEESHLRIIDTYSGQSVMESRYCKPKDKVRYTITLSSRFALPEGMIQAKIKDANFYYKYVITRQYSLTVRVDYAKLIQGKVNDQ